MDLLQKISGAGVVGEGGAGFPTHVKLDAKVEYLLVNALECEPLLHTDKYIIRNFSAEIASAIESVQEHIGAKQAIIGIKLVNATEIGILKQAISSRPNISIFPMDNYYPAGDEQMLVFDTIGRVVPPGGLPIHVGAVVLNVGTLLDIKWALEGRPVTHKYLSVSGEVANPSVLHAPIGTTFKECVEACGGSLISEFTVIDGGPLMGKVMESEALSKRYVTKTTSGIILTQRLRNFTERLAVPIPSVLNRAKSACIQCRLCTDLCPRYLIGHRLRPHRIMRAMAGVGQVSANSAQILKEALICCECGICEAYACPMNLLPRQVNKYVKELLRKVGVGYEADALYPPHKVREYRKISPYKLMARMGLGGLMGRKADHFQELSPRQVTVPLKQHIGKTAEAIVKEGEIVEVGQLIGRCMGSISANVHASIKGTVTSVDNGFITISNQLEGGV